MIRIRKLIDVFAVGLMALAMLAISSRLVDTSRIHVGGLDDSLNDQVIYISAAREYAETGVLQSDTILPATLYLRASKNYFYLPGHYLALASSYKLFGFGSFQSLLPNLVSFVLSALGVFLTGAKLYGRRVGYLAAFLFAIFPPNVIYAFTAMSELTRSAVSILAFCVFVYLSDRWRLRVGPLLLVVPFLFRETGAFLAVPMALIILMTKSAHRLARTGAFVLAAFIVLFIIYNSGLSSGRPNLVNAFVFDPRFTTIHTDAVAQKAVAFRTPADWINAVPHKILNDGAILADQIVFNQPPGRDFEIFSFEILFLALVAALVFGLLNRDAFLIGSGALSAITVLMLLALFIPVLGGHVRGLLFTFPFGAIVFAWLYHRYVFSHFIPNFNRVRPLIEIGLLVLLLGASLYGIYRTAYRVAANDARDDQFTACIERLGHDDKRMLVAPYYMADYVYHHTVRGALVPANKETLSLLQANFDIGTLIVRTSDGESLEETWLSPADLASSGLVQDGEMSCNKEDFLVFRSTTK